MGIVEKGVYLGKLRGMERIKHKGHGENFEVNLFLSPQMFLTLSKGDGEVILSQRARRDLLKVRCF